MWTVKSLLTMGGVDAGVVASEARALLGAALADDWRGDELGGRVVANVFFEDSTRTRVSFSIAAHDLGASVVDLTSKGSSVAKGETLLDTAWTIEAMGVDVMVVRAGQSGACALIDAHTRCSVINAGDGSHQHPTQALADALTIGRSFERDSDWDFRGLKIAIVGDVVSSRVARSNAGLLTAMGAEVVLVGPPSMVPGSLSSLGSSLGCTLTSEFDSVVGEVDAVMMLRIQFERGSGGVLASTREYHARYGMNESRAAKMKRGGIVMHPGPMNRGVEIAAAVADGERSAVLDQVNNGVLVRKAVLAHAGR